MTAKKNCYLALVSTGCALLLGCASAPGPVVADVPLVHPNYGLKRPGQPVNIAPMKTLSPGDTIAINDTAWEIGQLYFSASRQHCYALQRVAPENQLDANEARLCESGTTWAFYPSVLANGLAVSTSR